MNRAWVVEADQQPVAEQGTANLADPTNPARTSTPAPPSAAPREASGTVSRIGRADRDVATTGRSCRSTRPHCHSQIHSGSNPAVNTAATAERSGPVVADRQRFGPPRAVGRCCDAAGAAGTSGGTRMGESMAVTSWGSADIAEARQLYRMDRPKRQPVPLPRDATCNRSPHTGGRSGRTAGSTAGSARFHRPGHCRFVRRTPDAAASPASARRETV